MQLMLDSGPFFVSVHFLRRSKAASRRHDIHAKLVSGGSKVHPILRTVSRVGSNYILGTILLTNKERRLVEFAHGALTRPVSGTTPSGINHVTLVGRVYAACCKSAT